MLQLVGIREYARYRGVRHRAVQKAIEAARTEALRLLGWVFSNLPLVVGADALHQFGIDPATTLKVLDFCVVDALQLIEKLYGEEVEIPISSHLAKALDDDGREAFLQEIREFAATLGTDAAGD